MSNLSKMLREHRPLLVAEAGAGHNGDPRRVATLIEAAVAARADAVTFQEIDEQRLFGLMDDRPVPLQKRVGWNCLREAKRLAAEHGLLFSVCVTDEASLESALAIGIDFIKIVSYDITHVSFVKQCVETKLPIFLSTGASTLDEVQTCLERVGDYDQIMLYHTDCGYPTADDEVNLLRMKRLSERFGHPVGYCDHTDHGLSCLAAAALGASVIEKHFLVEPTRGVVDAEVSLLPAQLVELFAQIRRVVSLLGKGEDIVMEGDRYRRAHLRRSLALNRSKRKGETIEAADLTMLRPGTGLDWDAREALIGHVCRTDLPRRKILSLDDVH